MARLGSRFNLLFEPHHRRVMHSALGRFLDRPLDLMVGLVEPDGTRSTLPFTVHGSPLVNAEQFERMNSITFRGYSEKYSLRFEFNVHSVFYPQDELLCLMPAFYLEMRVSPMPRIRWVKPVGEPPERVRLFIRLDRPDTQIKATMAGDAGQIDLAYRNTLRPTLEDSGHPLAEGEQSVQVYERIVSLNTGCEVDETGRGLSLELPVREVGSGVKWRLVWGAHCGDIVLRVRKNDADRPARFRYVRHWSNIDEVMQEAVTFRDDRLAHSRRLEKIVEQAPLNQAQRHLIHQSFQAFQSNTFWCDIEPDQPLTVTDPSDPDALKEKRRNLRGNEWFSVWEGSEFYHSTLDVEYNVALVYLTLWPRLLAMQLDTWPPFEHKHEPSAGGYMSHDMGYGMNATGQASPLEMPVEENCNYLLLMQAYAHWTGDLSLVKKHAALLERLTNYLLWCDRDGSGFPSEGVRNTFADALPSMHTARKQTYLAVKRLAALRAAADLLFRAERGEAAERAEDTAERDLPSVEAAAWLGDHYVVCLDRSGDVVDSDRTPTMGGQFVGNDAYSIHTGNGLLLPAMVGQPTLLDPQRLLVDHISANREAASPYGCGHSSAEPENVWISQNMWREHIARYLNLTTRNMSSRYWDLQAMSNCLDNSLGYADTYINNNLVHYPRGVASIGYLLAHPRLVIDRLAPGGARISVEPDRHAPQRWPLLPLADWKAGKVPVCVVDAAGHVTIEGEADPVIVRGEEPTGDHEVIG